MKCPHCKEYLFFFDRVIKEINFCPFCGEKITRVDANTFSIRKTNLDQGVQIGDTIRFGLYPQDEEKASIIEWIVLDRVENNVLLQSKTALDYQPYHKEWKSVSWEDSSLRRWLNSDFLLTAFHDNNFPNILFTSKEDHSSFLKEMPLNHDMWDIVDSYDRVFLLNQNDLQRFNVSLENMKKAATKHTLKRGAIATKENLSWWWTQDSANISEHIEFVTPDGDICHYGSDINCYGSVCPAMWVKL